ncbi:MAG: hypothetical protein JSV89_05460 [Spirochaetaceae bacterium]|nr:MAG: hypothetical protein JSV89_05460 [Spirochaetaceae bacterium]
MKRQTTTGWIFGTVLVLVVLLSSCSMLGDAVVGGISSGVSKGVSKGVEQEVEKEVAEEAQPSQSKAPAAGPQWNQFMIMQAQMVFSYAFSAGGMWAGQKEYKPGEYTKFEWSMEGEDTIVLERAYLKELEDGKQWWRVSWEDSEGLWIWEVLIDPEESGSGQMLRMRARDADGNQGEVPVSGETVYMPPAELTKESVQGATVAKEKVTVPAGTFQSDHVIYMAATGEGQVEFWLAPQIPGGVVRYLISEKGKGEVWTSDLIEFGKNATTILGSY